MIKNFIVEDDSIGIPILETEDFCWLSWKDGETFEEMYMQNSETKCCICESLYVYTYDNEEIECTAYEIKCQKTGNLFFLICFGDLTEFENLQYWVCVYNNFFNILKFSIDYMLPFSDKKVVL